MKQEMNSTRGVLLPVDHPSSIRRWKWRMFKDGLARHTISFGGNFVIIAIVLIFFYLAYEVFPLFSSVHAEQESLYKTDSSQNYVYLGIEEQAEVAESYTPDGFVTFFDARTGRIVRDAERIIPSDARVSAYAHSAPAARLFAYGLEDGRVVVARSEYIVTYPDDKRKITPDISFPLGKEPIVIDDNGQKIVNLAVQKDESAATIIALTEDRRLVITAFEQDDSLFAEEGDFEISTSELTTALKNIRFILLNRAQDTLYLIGADNSTEYYSLRDKSDPELIDKRKLTPDNQVTSATFHTGGISLLTGHKNGEINQWFPVRSKLGDKQLQLIRTFSAQTEAIMHIAPEHGRKGFLASGKGTVGVYHSTSGNVLKVKEISKNQLKTLAVAPRANYFMASDSEGHIAFWQIDNEYPEVSWSSLWNKVWYESYDEPAYIWQSSSASNDFEPKFSLTPLAFGTLKAAFYAMLFAVPLAIMGAIYTAYFMSAKMRGLVKPTIEIMEALPTVILGFLAGLWLAPMIEENLPAFFSMFLILPVGVLLFAWVWHRLPGRWLQEIPEGWEGLILVPVITLLVMCSFWISPWMENTFFGGHMPGWISNELGIDFDQRNSIVVGLAMGFAVIPTIFSITEDAVFSVPKHLSNGSLALGATRWQTLIGVVILTASPAIFSAVMIGLGRAIGETMIVLMATGNTPIMDFNIFEGMRTLSANVAVEVPESEVGSSHYRILFLAALVLFLFTFIFNTIAEIVRQRLRKKYSSL